jgi:hypothetical protein
MGIERLLRQPAKRKCLHFIKLKKPWILTPPQGLYSGMEAVTSPIINNYLTFVNENNLNQYKILFYKKAI